METFKKICKALLFPHIAIMIILIPIATAFLIYSMLVLGTESVVSIISYVLAAYTLTIWCFKIPNIIRFFKNFKKENKYAQMWFSDVHLRTSLTLYGSLIWNTAYALFQLWLGITLSTFWYYSLAGYYICLALMRFFLSAHTRKHIAGEKMYEELKKYRICGWVFLTMNLVLTVMIFFMIYWNRTFEHDQITTITLAAYTFTTFTFAIVNIVRYRKYNSPVYSASKAISLTAACVSMITLTSTMLTTFGTAEEASMRRLMLALLGAAVAIFITTMAIYMIRESTKKMKALKAEEPHES